MDGQELCGKGREKFGMEEDGKDKGVTEKLDLENAGIGVNNKSQPNPLWNCTSSFGFEICIYACACACSRACAFACAYACACACACACSRECACAFALLLVHSPAQIQFRLLFDCQILFDLFAK